MFPGLRFETRIPVVRASTARADVACFVGFVRVRPKAEAYVRERSAVHGWRIGAEAFTEDASLPPVLVESTEAFDALFDGWIRPTDGRRWEGYLSGAVHDFFRQGGRRAWVVAVGAPVAPEPGDAQPSFEVVRERLIRLIPGIDGEDGFARTDRSTWRGLGHLLGLPEVAVVCLPDLPALVGAPALSQPELPSPSSPEPRFVECSVPPPPAAPASKAIRAPAAPRLGLHEMARWQCATAHALHWVKRHRPDVQLILALPLREPGSMAATRPLDDLVGFDPASGHRPDRSRLWVHGAPRSAPAIAGGQMGPPRLGDVEVAPDIAELDGTGIGSAWLQLVFPWTHGDTTLDRREGLGAPDGLAAGILARATLRRGTFRSLAGEPLEGVAALEPDLSPVAIFRTRPPEQDSTRAPAPGPTGPLERRSAELALRDRLLLLGETPRGRLEVLSDRTTSSVARWRFGGTNRLLGVVYRSLRAIGEELVFEPSGRATWTVLVERTRSVLEALARQGALADEQAFAVRCDGRTMNQADIDAGRMIAEVTIRPAEAIDGITVVMTVSDATAVGLSSERGD